MPINLQKAEFILSAASPKDFIRDELPQVAFAGRSNVGKSSVINRLLNRKNLARVGAAPGKTTHINYFNIDRAFYLVDLPGYGYAKVAKSEKYRWAELIEGYLNDPERDLGLVLLLIDIRHPPTQLDCQMANYLIETERPFLVVLTKADKLNKTEREKRLSAIADELPCGDELTIVPFSSQTGEGVEVLRGILEEISAPEESGE